MRLSVCVCTNKVYTYADALFPGKLAKITFATEWTLILKIIFSAQKVIRLAFFIRTNFMIMQQIVNLCMFYKNIKYPFSIKDDTQNTVDDFLHKLNWQA